MNVYLTAHEYASRITGLTTSDLVGNLVRVGTGAVTQGATSLPVSPVTTVQLNQWDNLYVLDGANSEVVTVTATTAAGASSVPISATQYAHVAGVSCCSDGPDGSLGAALIEGSAIVETACRQPLLQQTNTNETLPLLTTRAWIDNSGQLTVRPRQFPVQGISAMSLLLPGSIVINLDMAQLQLDSTQRLATITTIKTISGNGNTYPFLSRVDQTTRGVAQLSYVAGYLYSQLPPAIKRAATLLVSDIISDQFNPTGAASLKQGKLSQEAFLRGDASGESALVKRARHWLKGYIQDAV